ncbi:hypothetical protein AGABI1DRAFT_106074 [Agaricus bisporus var. burnettii JB137-S8]|uniref:GED domain-containing protein n=1 Tax=Agaricus bisporus var. burnettii (strain JB137-S8 / ATCC MYA-4627 / FGSC 10392) TaxID=597362 RepID=K5W3G6_AGABU|nr:uncharacterized protein AGABI1DRAFT_106074 [Agaricus bisporus var. burnettii JB137-S8]EKM81339.1 hypothetical protein AGABI1DRAFT_106074 [Agaricus bisporus var. burnettii JB137-S8]
MVERSDYRIRTMSGSSSVSSSPTRSMLSTDPDVKTLDLTIGPPNGASSEAVGLCNPQMSQQQRRMLDLVNGLHSTGVQVDIDLPQIAVVGNQSAGKSSLIESISGITLPRASGTCTRCPTECRLSYSSQPWKCVVSLRITTDRSGQPLGQSRNETFGSTIYDKKEVDDRIRRAQLAILNPDKPAKSFLNDDEPSLTEGNFLTFSKNCVSLAISGPDVADLSFVDLPGLIASVGRGGNAGDIKLVEGLVTTYIHKTNCIILLTVACETDFENQGAHQLAKQYDPEGKRTIGVLTKPDRIPAGEEQNWLKFIRNEKEPLQNNWFCVKQPASSDLKNNWTWQQARQKEDEFFTATSPWNELEAMYVRYLRTKNLVERLSQVLSDLIAKTLPGIQREIEGMISKTRQQINDLPKPPPTNALNEVAKLVKDFDADIRRNIEGVAYKEGLIQRIRVPAEKFRRVIQKTAPAFKPYNDSGNVTRLADPEFLKQENDGDSDADEEDDEDEDDGATALLDESVESIYVNEVHARMTESRSRELPGNFPFVVQREYILDILLQWEKPTMWLCDRVFRILAAHTRELVHHHFATFGQGLLEQRVQLVMYEHLGKCLEAAKKKVVWLLKIEGEPFTVNNHYLADYKEKFLVYYRRARQDAKRKIPDSVPFKFLSPKRAKTSGNGGNIFAMPSAATDSTDPIKEALTALSRAGYPGLTEEDLPKLLGQDAMEPALEIMATVRAYFQVSYKRFVDNVPMAIDYELVRGGGEDVFQLLWGKLELDRPGAQEMCKDYAQEGAQVADRREELEKKLERLMLATRRLINSR